MSNPISVCMIVQDEEECVQRAIDSIEKYVDEIIIIDGGSTDKTREICLSNEKVELFDIPFNPVAGDRFDVQKNNAIERARNEWILFIDADEYYNKYVGESLELMINPKENNGTDAYSFSRKTFIDDRLYNIENQDWQIRLFRKYCRYNGIMHEGICGYNKHSLTNLDIMHYKKNEWQHKDNERVWEMGQEPPDGWIKFDGKWEWIGNGYEYPDIRFWTTDEQQNKVKWYDTDSSRILYNKIMPIEQPMLQSNELGYSPGEILIRDEIAKMEKVSLLDIGCANGRFGIALLRDKLIDSLIGIDVSDEEITRADETMLNAGVNATFIRSPLDEFNTDSKFDVVTMNECLEHVYNPYQAIREIVDKFLTPDSLFAGNVPHLFTCNCEHHLHYFSVNSLKHFLEQFFNDVEIDKKNYYDTQEEHYPEYHLTFLCRSPK